MTATQAEWARPCGARRSSSSATFAADGCLPISATTIIVAKPATNEHAAWDAADIEPAEPEGAAAAC